MSITKKCNCGNPNCQFESTDCPVANFGNDFSHIGQCLTQEEIGDKLSGAVGRVNGQVLFGDDILKDGKLMLIEPNKPRYTGCWFKLQPDISCKIVRWYMEDCTIAEIRLTSRQSPSDDGTPREKSEQYTIDNLPSINPADTLRVRVEPTGPRPKLAAVGKETGDFAIGGPDAHYSLAFMSTEHDFCSGESPAFIPPNYNGASHPDPKVFQVQPPELVKVKSLIIHGDPVLEIIEIKIGHLSYMGGMGALPIGLFKGPEGVPLSATVLPSNRAMIYVRNPTDRYAFISEAYFGLVK